MIWKVHYTSLARYDLKITGEYISEKLLAPDAASRQVERIMGAIQKLRDMPLRNPVYEDAIWQDFEIRYTRVDNYLIFYIVIEELAEVNVVRIMYRGRDIRKQLEKNE